MRKIYLPLVALLLATVSCKDFSFISFGEEPLAVVGRKSLYLSDVKDIFSKGMSREDSLSLLQAHVDSWVKTQIKIQEAEELFADEEDEFEALMESYRNSLLIYRYDRSLSGQVDTSITNAQITDYYNRNKEQFRLVGPVAKARILAFPADYRQAGNLRRMISSASKEDYADLVDIADKSSFFFKEYTDGWHYFRDILTDIPFREKDFDAFLRRGKLYEYKDGDAGVIYLMSVTAYRNTGEYIPLEMIVPTIKQAIINRHRADFIKSREDSLYAVAVRSRHVTLNIDTSAVVWPEPTVAPRDVPEPSDERRRPAAEAPEREREDSVAGGAESSED